MRSPMPCTTQRASHPLSRSVGAVRKIPGPRSRKPRMNAALQDAAALGVTVTVAAGDNGSTDGVGDGKLHVDFPASSPYALACGGTTLKGLREPTFRRKSYGTKPRTRKAQPGAASAMSSRFRAIKAPPEFRTSGQTGKPGRGVPDVAGDADPSTGYQIRVDGQNQVVGGTSAVAPLWAALIALINQQAGKPVGFINPALYAGNEDGFHDITSGNNDDSNLGFYSAQKGWDACTGLGSPDGTAILQLLTSSATAAVASGKNK